MTTAIILSIGDELVLGQTVDTNSAWISAQLAALGVGVGAHITVPDDQPAIERAIRESQTRCNWLIVSGGIGPTEDDLTRQALAAVMQAPLEENAIWIAELERFFAARGRSMPPINRIQAMIPRGAEMIFNTAGTAAGMRATLSAGADRSCMVFVMPGVPKEMKAMFARDVFPIVEKASSGAVILSRTVHTYGLGESAIAQMLGDLMRRDRNPSVGTTVSGGVVSLRLNSRFPSRELASRQLEETYDACVAALGDIIYGSEEQTLPTVLKELLERNGTAKSNAPAVATAESCTGGLVAKMLTDISGSSGYFRAGFVTYTNEAKVRQLGVDADVIAKNGAVSEPVARQMAEGARLKSGAVYALALTGIAGPTGGTVEKPVGTVWIALASPRGVDARRFNFPGDREMIRDRAAKTALNMLRYELMDQRMPDWK